MHSAHRKERAPNMICNARYLNIGMVKLYDFRYLSILQSRNASIIDVQLELQLQT